MSWIDFQYIKTGTGELSGPSFVAQTEQAVNELGGFINSIESTATDAAAAAVAAQQAAGAAQQTANSAVSQAQAATALANQAQQTAKASQQAADSAQNAADAAQASADDAQNTANEALAVAQGAQGTADGKAPLMHASTNTTYGTASGTLYGHVQLSDAIDGTQNAAEGGTAATPYAVAQVSTVASAAQQAAAAAQQTAAAVQASLDQYAESVGNQINSLNFFITRTTAVDAGSYAGSHAQLYLTSEASASTGMPAGITYPCYFWTEATSDTDACVMYVLSSGNVLYSQTGINTTPEANTPTWSMSGWKLTVPVYTGATASTAGTAGLVPPAAAAQQGYVLQGDGTWLNVQGASAHASMPGAQSVSISLDSNPFTPPTDGWIQYKAVTSVINSWLSLTCSTGLYVSAFSPLAVSNLGIFIPVAANASVSFSSSDTSTFTSRTATFYYAQGAQS